MARRRPKGTGAVRKLPSGRWQARIDNGAGVLVSLGSYATKTDAAHALSVALGDQARGRWTDPTAGRLTLGEYAGEWLQHRSTIAARTAELYDSLLRNHILPTFADLALADISTRLVRQWHSRMLSAGQPGTVTVAKSYRLLRSLLATAVEDGLIATNPCVIKGAGVERSPERPVATIAQVFALAEAVEPRYRMLILLATFASMRFGELGALTRSSIDLETGLIEITEAASELADGTRVVGRAEDGRRPPHRRRTRVLHDDLRRICGTRTGGAARTGLRRARRRAAAAKQLVEDVARATAQLGLGHLHFHDLRHTGNTLAAATGASTKELMSRMGHSSSRAALIYQHATAERELEIAQRLSDMVLAATVDLAPQDRDRAAPEPNDMPLLLGARRSPGRCPQRRTVQLRPVARSVGGSVGRRPSVPRATAGPGLAPRSMAQGRAAPWCRRADRSWWEGARCLAGHGSRTGGSGPCGSQ